MNTSELLALLAPHREALAALGWEVNGGNPVAKNVTEVRSPDDWDVMSATNASLLIESIVRRELDRWASEHTTDECQWWFESNTPSDDAGDYGFALWSNEEPLLGDDIALVHVERDADPLAALLSLWAWTRGVKG